jgi:hypothetical protein
MSLYHDLEAKIGAERLGEILLAPTNVTFSHSGLVALCKKIESQIPGSQTISIHYQGAVNLYEMYKRMDRKDEDLRINAANALDKIFTMIVGQNCVSQEIDYFRATRLPHIKKRKRINVSVSAIDSIVYELISKHGLGKIENTDVAFERSNWFGNIASIVDQAIPKEKIRQASESYCKTGVNYFHHYVAKQRAIDVLFFSEYGRGLLKRAAGICFTDLALHNQILKDTGDRGCTAFCVPKKRRVYIDLQNNNVFENTGLLAHELAHITNTQLTLDSPSFKSLREAHSVAAQYIVAGQQIDSGLKEEDVLSPLDSFRLSTETINLLCVSPSDFIREASQSNMLRERWRLKDEERQIDDGVVKQLAATLPRLTRPLPEIPHRTL